MSLRRKTILSILAAVVAGLSALLLFAKDIVVRVPAAEVQGRIDALLPIEGSKMGVSYRIVRADTDLRLDGRVGITVSASASVLRSSASAVFVGSGRIAYRDGAFFLEDFQSDGLRDLSVGLDGQDRAAATAAAEASADAALGAMKVEPAARERFKDRVASALRERADGSPSVLDSAKAALLEKTKEASLSALRSTLERHPLYRLKSDDAKHVLARLALKSVSVEKDALIVVLSPWNLVFKILLGAVAGVFLLAFAVGLIVTAPEAAVVFALFG